MKTIKSIALFLAATCAALSTNAQTFTNLNFESATPSTPISGPLGPGVLYQPVGLALPGWTAYLGAVQQTEVIQNSYGFGTAEVILFGPNYPAAGSGPGIIDGDYSVLLQAGADPVSSALESASISQTGVVPIGIQSLDFAAWTTSFTEFSVSFDGINLSPVALGSGPNSTTIYGVNISSYDGQTGPLEFSALFSGTGASWLGLDDISFSTTVLSPEPNMVALSGIGGLLLAARMWLARRK
jgi:hypothetical protein